MVKKNVISLLVVAAMVILMFASFPAYAVDIGFIDEHGAEGDELWEAYKAALEPLMTDYPESNDAIDTWTEQYMAKTYENATGRPQEEFKSLSAYDRMLLGSTFLEPYHINIEYGQSFRDSAQWNTWVSSDYKSLFKRWSEEDSQETILAYDKLMTWLYNYYESSGAFYNFVEGKDTLDYIDDKYIEDMKSSDTSSTDATSKTATESEETVSYVESQVSQITSENVSYVAPVSSNVRANHKSNKAPYIIIGVLVVVVGVMAAMLLKKNKGNTEQK